MKKKKLIKRLGKAAHRIETHIALNSYMRNENLVEARDFLKEVIEDALAPRPEAVRPTDATYQAHLANHTALWHNTPTEALTEREPTINNFFDAILRLRGDGDNPDRGTNPEEEAPGEGTDVLPMEDVEFFIEVDRAIINHVDEAIRAGAEDPTFILRPYLRPTVVRLSQGDVVLHVSAIEDIDGYTPQPSPIA